MKHLVSHRYLQQAVLLFKKRPLLRYTVIVGLLLVFAITVAADHQSPTPLVGAHTYYPNKPLRFVSSWRLNMRTGPSTGYKIITKLEYGTPILTLGKTAANDWLLIELVNGQQGWVWREYTTPEPPTTSKKTAVYTTPNPVAHPHTFQGYVTSYRLNLRKGPSTDYKVLHKLNHHEPMKILGRNGTSTWLYVQTFDGLEGWVWAEYVHIEH